jgi:hypothetical protein
VATIVRNIKTKTGHPDEIYIGRGSKWENPYKIGKHGTRQQVIDLCERRLMCEPDLLAAIDAGELDNKVLLCFCHPQPCHGDVLAQLANARQQ